MNTNYIYIKKNSKSETKCQTVPVLKHPTPIKSVTFFETELTTLLISVIS